MREGLEQRDTIRHFKKMLRNREREKDQRKDMQIADSLCCTRN